jgi:hypothetical protein
MRSNSMSIAWDRLLRMMRYDPYLPMKCFAHESKLSRDSRNLESVKAPQSQGHKGVPP